jgi:hypothetical protein
MNSHLGRFLSLSNLFKTHSTMRDALPGIYRESFSQACRHNSILAREEDGGGSEVAFKARMKACEEASASSDMKGGCRKKICSVCLCGWEVTAPGHCPLRVY